MLHIKLGTYGPRNQFRVMTRRLCDNILGLLGTDRSFYYGYFFRWRRIIGNQFTRLLSERLTFVYDVIIGGSLLRGDLVCLYWFLRSLDLRTWTRIISWRYWFLPRYWLWVTWTRTKHLWREPYGSSTRHTLTICKKNVITDHYKIHKKLGDKSSTSLMTATLFFIRKKTLCTNHQKLQNMYLYHL